MAYNHNPHNTPHQCGGNDEEAFWLRQINDSIQALNLNSGNNSSPDGSLRGRLQFAYSDVSQRQIYAAPMGQLITRIVLIVLEPFDSAIAQISVGDDTNPDRLLSSASSDLTEACTWQAHPNYAYPQNSIVNLYLAHGGATQGRGVVLLYCD